VIDLHTHLAPGVDDGARDLPTAVAALARLAGDGVTTVVCTPHLRASAVVRGTAQTREVCAAFDQLAGHAPAGVTLALGREVMLDEPGVDLAADPALRLGGGSALLVEFPRGPVPVAAARELARLRHAGVIPVLAHPERHDGAGVAAVAAWRRAGAAVQVDATTLAADTARGHAARALVASGQADLLASDNHGDRRTLAVARDWLAARGLGTLADLLTRENPGRLLRGEPLLPPPPAPDVARRAPGIAAWLRARLTGAAPRPLVLT
jgi:protein-tyrosine phosphatase